MWPFLGITIRVREHHTSNQSLVYFVSTTHLSVYSFGGVGPMVKQVVFLQTGKLVTTLRLAHSMTPGVSNPW